MLWEKIPCALPLRKEFFNQSRGQVNQSQLDYLRQAKKKKWCRGIIYLARPWQMERKKWEIDEVESQYWLIVN